uniref:Uncharacterized protein n=1 Tax=Plectus sambesii TaxID=2011161 RepID=A0A914W6X2_9BILA
MDGRSRRQQEYAVGRKAAGDTHRPQSILPNLRARPLRGQQPCGRSVGRVLALRRPTTVIRRQRPNAVLRPHPYHRNTGDRQQQTTDRRNLAQSASPSSSLPALTGRDRSNGRSKKMPPNALPHFGAFDCTRYALTTNRLEEVERRLKSGGNRLGESCPTIPPTGSGGRADGRANRSNRS